MTLRTSRPRSTLVQYPAAPATLASVCVPACDDDAKVIGAVGGSGEGFEIPAGSVYTTVAQLETPNGTTTLLSFTNDVPSGELDTSSALELPGFADATTYEGSLFVTDGEALTLTRYLGGLRRLR